MSSRGRASRALLWTGELLLTAGVLLALFVAYLLWWTGVETSQAQDRLRDELGTAAPPAMASRAGRPDTAAEPVPGAAYAQLRIPRLGTDWDWVLIEGVDPDDLADGPGHYPGTADPGEVGNFSVAGHRATHGEPFADLDRMRRGDEVLVTRGGRTWRYLVDESFVTVPSDVAVVAPVPRRPGARPTTARITLTTCNPRYGSGERLVVLGTLDGAR
jgi:sortase A